jgi:probable rRNA maturation factor
LTELGRSEAELSLLLVDDPRIRVLNREHRGRDKATNVLAFAMEEGPFGALQLGLLGDVVISLETADRECVRYGVTPPEMVLLLLIHGILHLVGYEHEGTPQGARRMARKQKALFGRLKEDPRIVG